MVDTQAPAPQPQNPMGVAGVSNAPDDAATQNQALFAHLQANPQDIPDALVNSGSQFWDAPTDQQTSFVSKLSPDFANASGEDQDAVMAKIYQKRDDAINALKWHAGIGDAATQAVSGFPGGNLLMQGVTKLATGGQYSNIKDQMAARAQQLGINPNEVNNNPISNTLGTIGQIGAGALTFMATDGALKGSGVPNAAATTAVGLPFAYHAPNVIAGQETPLQAGSQIPIDIGANLVGLKYMKNRLVNAGFQAVAQGGAGAAGSVIDNVVHGKPINWQQAGQQALQQGAVGAGMGLAMGGRPSWLKGKATETTVPTPEATEPEVDPEELKKQQFNKAVAAKTQAIMGKQSIAEEDTLKGRLTGLKKLHEDASQGLSDPQTSPTLKAHIQKTLGDIRELHQNTKAELEAKYPPKTPEGKRVIQGTVNANQTYQNFAREGVKMVAQGKESAAKFNNFISSKLSAPDVRVIKGMITDHFNKVRARELQLKSTPASGEYHKQLFARVNEVMHTEGTNEEITLRTQKGQLEKIYQKVSQMANNPNSPPDLRITARDSLSTIADLHAAVSERHEAILERQAEAKSAAKQAEKLAPRNPEKKPTVTPGASAPKKDDKKDKADRYQAGLEELHKEGQSENKTLPLTTQKDILAGAAQAAKRKKTLLIEYEAEGGQSQVNENRIVAEGKARDGRTEANKIGGESADTSYRMKKISVDSIAPDLKGNLVVNAANENGQRRTYHVNEPESGSRIVSAQVLDEDAPHKFITDPETGKRVIVQNDEAVEQYKVEGTHSSELKAKLEDLVTRYKTGQNVGVHEIMDLSGASTGKSVKDIQTTLESLPHKDLDTLYKETTGEDCHRHSV
jgi:hypothetical protein